MGEKCRFGDLKFEVRSPPLRKFPADKLLKVIVLTPEVKSVADAVQAIGATEVDYFHWRSEYGGRKMDQVLKMEELEAESARLRWAVSDLTFDKMSWQGAHEKILSAALRRACIEHIGAPMPTRSFTGHSSSHISFALTLKKNWSM